MFLKVNKAARAYRRSLSLTSRPVAAAAAQSAPHTRGAPPCCYQRHPGGEARWGGLVHSTGLRPSPPAGGAGSLGNAQNRPCLSLGSGGQQASSCLTPVSCRVPSTKRKHRPPPHFQGAPAARRRLPGPEPRGPAHACALQVPPARHPQHSPRSAKPPPAPGTAGRHDDARDSRADPLGPPLCCARWCRTDPWPPDLNWEGGATLNVSSNAQR